MRRNDKQDDRNFRDDSPKDTSSEGNDFPGYPHYPSKEDITLNGRKEDIDVENISRKTPNTTPVDRTNTNGESTVEDDLGIVPGTSADVTKEDIRMLEATDGMRPTSRLEESDEIQEELSQSDLDIPGAEMDDSQESVGEEDEENNYYSLGGDSKENLEEDQS